MKSMNMFVQVDIRRSSEIKLPALQEYPNTRLESISVTSHKIFNALTVYYNLSCLLLSRAAIFFKSIPNSVDPDQKLFHTMVQTVYMQVMRLKNCIWGYQISHIP